MPGGKLEVIFRLVKLSSGEYFATLDVPMQKVTRLKVTVTMRADTVVLTSAEANATYVGRLTSDGNQLQGSWLQPGFKVPLALSHAEVQAAAAAPRLTPPYREEEVHFSNSSAKLQLAGTLTVPAGAGPFPSVVLLSDAGPHDRNGTVGKCGRNGNRSLPLLLRFQPSRKPAPDSLPGLAALWHRRRHAECGHQRYYAHQSAEK
nr:hypothetical protein [Tanacetum cinerariifolium]